MFLQRDFINNLLIVPQKFSKTYSFNELRAKKKNVKALPTE